MTAQANFHPLADEDFGDLHPVTRTLAAAVRADLLAEVERRERERRARRVDALLQVAIAVLSFAALFLVTSDSPAARWGHVIGLASQPFYIAAAWRARQWGMLAVAILICGVWLRGIANTF